MTGRVAIGGRDITDLAPERRRIGIQFQDDLLFPHLSVGGNLAFALPRARRARDQNGARASSRRLPKPIWPASPTATRPRCRAGSAHASP